MARQDIAGLLTGISSTQRPNPNASAADWRMQFGQQQAEKLGSVTFLSNRKVKEIKL